MMVLYCGKYSAAKQFVKNLVTGEVAVLVPGHMFMTPKEWSDLGKSFAKKVAEEQDFTDEPDNNLDVFCNSDHFLNGIRVARKQGVIPQQAIKVLFFSETGKKHELVIDDKGYLDAWPEGFFDQIETDLSALSYTN